MSSPYLLLRDDALKFILIFRNLYWVMVFRAFQGQMACPECLASRDHKDPKEGKAQKDRSVTRDRKECRVQEETEDAKGLQGKADPEESRE